MVSLWILGLTYSTSKAKTCEDHCQVGNFMVKKSTYMLSVLHAIRENVHVCMHVNHMNE